MVEGQCSPQINTLRQGITLICYCDGLQTSRSGYIMYPYLISVYGMGAGEFTSNRIHWQLCAQLTLT